MAHVVSTFFTSPNGPRVTGLTDVLGALAARTHSDLGRARAVALPYLPHAAAMQGAMARIDEARALSEAGTPLPAYSFPDIAPQVARLRMEAPLEGRELLQVAEVMEAMAATCRFGQTCAGAAPTLAAQMSALPDLSGPLAAVRAAIAPDGSVKDDASLDLAHARAQVRRISSRIRSQMEGYLTDEAMVPYLQDTYVSIRHDRYVLPINASFAAKVPGIIHNASQTGQTVFIEPAAITSLGNALALAQSQEAEEVLRVLTLLGHELAPACDALVAGSDRLADLDVVAAAAVLAESLHLSTPKLVAASEPLHLPHLSHPGLTLSGQTPVANTVELGAPHQVLLLSGPNGGGKTVILTSLGLATLMSRVGLPIAAAPGARLPAYEGMFCALGDAQNLSQGLSSFAAQLMDLKQIVTKMGPGWLVLIDELGGDTDPVVGAALGRAVLDDGAQHKAHLCVTTHLAALKAVALTDPRYVNARMGYDQTTGQPTFKMEWGVAGQSRGLDLARRLGFPAHILQAAEAHLGSDSVFAAALHKLEDMQQGLIAERAQLAALKGELAAANQQAQQAQEQAASARAKAQQQHHEALKDLFKGAQAQVRETLARLRHQASVESAQRAAHALSQEAEKIPAAVDPLDHVEHAPPKPEALRPGMWVRVRSLGKDAQIVAVGGEHVTVAMGHLRTRVRVDNLMLRPKAATSPAIAAQRAKNPHGAQPSAPRAPSRCDVRGLRLDEAERLVVRALDVCLSEGQEVLWVVHGHGTGQLKEGLRDLLRVSPYVASARPGDSHEGGEGITVVHLDR